MFRLDSSITAQDNNGLSNSHRNSFIAPTKSISTENKQLLQRTPHKQTNSINNSTEKPNQMLRIPQSRSSTLNTRNRTNKRHSVMISSYDVDSYNNRIDETTVDEEVGNDSESFIDFNKSFSGKHRSKSFTSFTNLADDEFNNTIDSDQILKDLDDNLKEKDSTTNLKEDNYLLTVNNAFSEFHSKVNGSLHINTNIQTDDSSDSDSIGNINKGLHPLHKLVISSPNSSSTTSKTRVISRSRSNTVLKRRSVLAPPVETRSSLSIPTLDPKSATNSSLIPTSNIIVERVSESISTKSKCQVISNCIFFGPVKEAPHSPTKPSQTNALEVFDYQNESPSKKSNTDKTMIAQFATALVDPELYSKSAGSVFSGPTTFPSRQRTSLHFV